MEKIFKKELEEKLIKPKNFKVVTVKTSYDKIEENLKIKGSDIFIEVEKIIDENSNLFSSYDISQSIDNATLSPMIHIIFYQ